MSLGTVTDLCSPMGVFHVFQEAERLVSAVIPKHLADAAPEVAVYLKESVGNSTRIDYGTGTWACTLARAGFVGKGPFGVGSFIYLNISLSLFLGPAGNEHLLFRAHSPLCPVWAVTESWELC